MSGPATIAVVTTAIVSDLHLGAGNESDLLQRADALAELTGALAGCDRLILLGDVVEMRDRPLPEALALAAPVLAALGAAVGPRGEVVVVPGNHDYRFASQWLEAELAQGRPLSALTRDLPQTDWPASPVAAAIGAPTRFSYPGVWVRDDVYATHGHYLDRHLTIPTFERLGVSLVERTIGIGEPGADPDDPDQPSERPAAYERVEAPVYAFLYALAQGAAPGSSGGTPSRRIWEALSGGTGMIGRARGFVLGSVALPGAVAAANRLGLGPVRSDVSPGALARGGVAAMDEVVTRLGIDRRARHVIFGHTHRRGPLPGEQAWITAGGTTLHNSGSWVHTPTLLGAEAAGSGYWPGTVAFVGDQGPPQLRHLLDGWTRALLAEATTEPAE